MKEFIYNEGKLINKRTGKVEGWIDNSGYYRVWFNGKKTLSHIIIWEIFYGKIPDGMQINHKNCNRTDNRIENLELVTQHQNLQRMKRHIDGKLVGACFDKSKNRWMSCTKKEQKFIFLGYFDSEQEAHERYLEFWKQYE